MPVIQFIDREQELQVLDSAWGSRPCLAVIYGRRRVGKTRLVLEWCRSRGVRCVYFNALPAKHEVNLSELARCIEASGLRGFARARYGSLDALLEAFAYRAGDAAVVLDEFTYWARAEPRVVGELQRFVDHVLPDMGLLLVVVGSLIGVMYRSVIGGGAPLYGRARYRVKLEELEPWHLPLFHPWMSRDDLVRLYALLGGVPYYHTLVKKGWGIGDTIRNLFLEPGAPLRDEVLFLLREEFRDPVTYYSILKAVARGAATPSAIADVTGIHRQHVSKYLHVLEQLGFVERERILFSKKGRYRVRDKVMATWFRLIEPIAVSTGVIEPEAVLPRVMEELESHTAAVFEEIARRYIEWLAARGALRIDKMGRFVHRGVEIDLVALDHRGRVVHLVEVKWSDLDERDVRRIARELEAMARYIPLEGYGLRLHVVARSYRGERIDGVEVATLRDMPFRTGV